MEVAANNIQRAFDFDGHSIRVFPDDKGNPWFVASEICDILGYANSRKTIMDHCKQDGVTKRYTIDNMGRQQESSFISEGNLYRLILKSKKPVAEKLESFICDEILPQIRKKGYYISKPVSQQLTIADYAYVPTQKRLVKDVATVLFNGGGKQLVMDHHTNNYIIHFGVRPGEYKSGLIRMGHKVKSKSGREVARIFKPEAACSMALHDDFVAQGHTLEKLAEMNLREKLEPAFKAIIQLGVTPAELTR